MEEREKRERERERERERVREREKREAASQPSGMCSRWRAQLVLGWARAGAGREGSPPWSTVATARIEELCETAPTTEGAHGQAVVAAGAPGCFDGRLAMDGKEGTG